MSYLSGRNFFENNATTLKIVSIGILALVLLIPLSMVESLIVEREARKAEVLSEISAKWGYAQNLVGPIVVIPFRKEVEDNRGRVTSVTKRLYLLPDKLEVSGEMVPTRRYRGIYEAVLYETELTLRGRFSLDALATLDIEENALITSGASVLIGISDIKGVKEAVDFRLGEQTLKFDPGSSGKVIPMGVSAKLDDLEDITNKAFVAKISLRGSQALHLAPVGMTTQALLSSSWDSPSFLGSFLPYQREVSGKGFSAAWKVLHFNRSYPQAWVGNRYNLGKSLFGVELLVLADAYQQSMRTIKYALMFIGLTFLAFFFSEVMNKRRVHPVQYLLVGFSLVVFYSLLIAISEHISFAWAYLVSAVAITVLVTGYASAVLASSGLAIMVGGILTILYAYLYLLLQLEDYALLSGSIGLFAVLSAVMIMTRKLDWYRLARRPAED